VFLPLAYKKKTNGRKWIMVLSYFSQKQCFSAR
jgi:hypothetical protein